MADVDEKKTSALNSNVDERETEIEPAAKYDFDDLIKLVGGFGRYNTLLYAFMCLMSIPIGFQQLVQVFYGATPGFSCVLSAESIALNQSCGASKCCTNCTSYSYGTQFTSAVTEVRLFTFWNDFNSCILYSVFPQDVLRVGGKG